MDILRGDKERAQVNLWEVLQKNLHSAAINSGEVLDLFFKSYGVVPDASGCSISNSFNAQKGTGALIEVSPGSAVGWLSAQLFGDFPSQRNVLARLDIKETAYLNVSSFWRDEAGFAHAYVGIAPYRLYHDEEELKGIEPFTSPVVSYPMLARYE